MRKTRAAVLLAAAAGAIALLRRRSGAKTHVDVWFDDGSSVSLPGTTPPGSALVDLAAIVLRAAR
jgi:hypothetical protein